MFHTLPEAAFPLPVGLAAPGMRAWRWIEFALQAPYFLVALAVKDGEFEMGKHILSTDIEQVVALCGFDQVGVRVNSVCALLPGYVTGTAVYSLHQITEVWENPDDPHDQVFVTLTGDRFQSFGITDDAESVDRICTLRLPINT